MPNILANSSTSADRLGIIDEKNVKVPVLGHQHLPTGPHTILFIQVKERSRLSPGTAAISGVACSGFVGHRRPINVGPHQSPIGQQRNMRSFFEGCDPNRRPSLSCTCVDDRPHKCHQKEGQADLHSNHVAFNSSGLKLTPLSSTSPAEQIHLPASVRLPGRRLEQSVHPSIGYLLVCSP